MVTAASPSALRSRVPAKITSSMRAPRRLLADCSPSTQLMASLRLDLPHPFGPTMAAMPPPLKRNSVRSQKDLKPCTSTRFSFSKTVHLVLPGGDVTILISPAAKVKHLLRCVERSSRITPKMLCCKRRPARRPFLLKCPYTFCEIRATDNLVAHLAGQHPSLLPALSARFPQEGQAAADGRRAGFGRRTGNLAGAFHHPGSVDDMVHQTVLARFTGTEDPAGQGQFGGPALARQPPPRRER